MRPKTQPHSGLVFSHAKGRSSDRHHITNNLRHVTPDTEGHVFWDSTPTKYKTGKLAETESGLEVWGWGRGGEAFALWGQTVFGMLGEFRNGEW